MNGFPFFIQRAGRSATRSGGALSRRGVFAGGSDGGAASWAVAFHASAWRLAAAAIVGTASAAGIVASAFWRVASSFQPAAASADPGATAFGAAASSFQVPAMVSSTQKDVASPWEDAALCQTDATVGWAGNSPIFCTPSPLASPNREPGTGNHSSTSLAHAVG